jgi:predicted enzyme related to lactoylglutathione lyase
MFAGRRHARTLTGVVSAEQRDVPDVEAALAKAEELGGSRVMGPDEVMDGLVIGLFTDPEGHRLGS